MIQTIFIAGAVLIRILSNPLANVFQKQLTAEGHHPLMINFLSYFLLALGCIYPTIVLPITGLSFEFWKYSLLSGIAGALGNGFLIKALQKGDLSVLGPVNAYKSIVSMIIGLFLLKETPNTWGLLGLILIVYGSYFVLDSGVDKFSWGVFQKPAIQYRIFALILTAVEAVFIKKMILASTAGIAFIAWCWLGALCSFVLLLIYGVNLTKSWALMKTADTGKYLLLILCLGAMQLSTIYTFKYIPVVYALALFQLSILLTVFFGYAVFKESGFRKKLFGAAVMVLGSLIIILLKDS